jgi:hypothetical protein
MKNLKFLLLGLGCAALIALILFSYQPTLASNQGGSNPSIGTTTDQPVLAQSNPSGTMDKKAVFRELKQLAKKYRRASQEDDKARIRGRAEELMGHLFDDKMQTEEQHIATLEARLAKMKDKMHEMKAHEADLIHQGVTNLLNQGQMPDWTKTEKTDQ